MIRVAVYGRDGSEKVRLMTLIDNSERWKFISSPPVNRFTLVDEGFNPPYYTASLQILFFNLDKENFQSIDSLDRDFRPCDINRPLMLILKGTAGEELKQQIESQVQDNIVCYWVRDIEEIELEHLTNTLLKLEEQFYPENTSFNYS